MADLCSLLGDDGPPITFEHNGKTYKLRLISTYVMAQFERWVKDRARDALVYLRDLYTPEEFAKERAGLLAEIEAGSYLFFGTICQQAIASEPGAIKLGALVFGCSEDEFVRLSIARAVDVATLLDQVRVESGLKMPAPEAKDEQAANEPSSR